MTTFTPPLILKKELTSFCLTAALVLISQISTSQLGFAQTSANTPEPLSEKDIKQLQVKTQIIINVLIKKGIIDAETGRELVLKAEQEAAKEYGEATETVKESQKDQPAKNESNVVRVPYVSKHLRDQIRDQVRQELEKDVVDAVMQKAKEERWGVTNSWPAWIQQIRLSGDVRPRLDTIQFSDDNSTQYIDVLAVNKAGGTIPAGVNAFLNTTEDVNRISLRARLNADITLSPNWNMGIRMGTGKSDTPVSANLTLSKNFSNAEFSLHRAFIHYHTNDNQFQLWTGRFANPWLSTDLVWDEDVNFGGIAASYAPWRELKDGGVEPGFDPYVTLGVFPLEEISLSQEDKWLYGSQLGLNYHWSSGSALKMGVAYYDYNNTEGELNSFGSELLDHTAPGFAQKGNTLFDIRNDDDPESQLAALASDYDEINVTLSYDIANFSPTHLVFIADYVKNIGFNAREKLSLLEAETGLDFDSDAIEAKDTGYKFEVLVGQPKIAKGNDWSVSVAYKTLERDAVIDAFADSDFHLGGTDGKGYVLSAKYGLSAGIWLHFRLLSSNEIDGPPLGVDRYQLDLNAQF